MSLVLFRCSACGHTIELNENARAWHQSCRLRPARAPYPPYVREHKASGTARPPRVPRVGFR